jgi:hypothetical protein
MAQATRLLRSRCTQQMKSQSKATKMTRRARETHRQLHVRGRCAAHGVLLCQIQPSAYAALSLVEPSSLLRTIKARDYHLTAYSWPAQQALYNQSSTKRFRRSRDCRQVDMRASKTCPSTCLACTVRVFRAAHANDACLKNREIDVQVRDDIDIEQLDCT